MKTILNAIALLILSLAFVPLQMAYATDSLTYNEDGSVRVALRGVQLTSANCEEITVHFGGNLATGDEANIQISVVLTPTDGSAPLTVDHEFTVVGDELDHFKVNETFSWNQVPGGEYRISGEATLVNYNSLALNFPTAAAHFLACEACTGSIGNYVWFDENRDGTQDDSEIGINGAIVSLDNMAGGTTNTLTATGGPLNQAGYYQFENLCLGQYIATSDVDNLGSGYTPTLIGDALLVPDDSNNPAGTLVTLPANNSTDQTIDFGYVLPRYDIGTGTPGFWKNHPDAWPVEEITVGGVTYTKAEAIRNLKKPVRNDKTYSMYAALVPAMLNVALGTDSSCIADTIFVANDWM